MLRPYEATAYSDFTDAEPQASYEKALGVVESRLGLHAPLLIGGEHITTSRTIESIDPSRPDRVIGTASSASPDHAVQALDAAWAAYPEWAARSA